MYQSIRPVIRPKSSLNRTKYIHFKYAYKTVLGRLEAEINHFLCFDNMMVIYATSIRDRSLLYTCGMKILSTDTVNFWKFRYVFGIFDIFQKFRYIFGQGFRTLFSGKVLVSFAKVLDIRKQGSCTGRFLTVKIFWLLTFDIYRKSKISGKCMALIFINMNNMNRICSYLIK